MCVRVRKYANRTVVKSKLVSTWRVSIGVEISADVTAISIPSDITRVRSVYCAFYRRSSAANANGVICPGGVRPLTPGRCLRDGIAFFNDKFAETVRRRTRFLTLIFIVFITIIIITVTVFVIKFTQDSGISVISIGEFINYQVDLLQIKNKKKLIIIIVIR